MEEMEPVFRALADPNRRFLLDQLHERDGQTLLELQRQLPMTRFGTMKHLKILEDAGLVITRKVGREKYHYLNRVPIQMVYDRWVMKYARPWTRTLTGLKYFLEDSGMSDTVSHYFEVYIRSTPEKIWQALTDGDLTRQYYFGTAVESDWEKGSPVKYHTPDGFNMLSGEVLEVDPPKRLVMTFQANWDDEAKNAPVSTTTYEITPYGETCKLTLVHDGLDPQLRLTQGVRQGWSQILSALKTLLETGQPLVLPSMGEMESIEVQVAV
jgi:uncharacterized protein YndB with AHSA1/START domain